MKYRTRTLAKNAHERAQLSQLTEVDDLREAILSGEAS